MNKLKQVSNIIFFLTKINMNMLLMKRLFYIFIY